MIYGCSPDFKTYVSTDWISATVKHENRSQMQFLTAFDDLYERKYITGLHGYNSGLRWENGGMMFWHDSKPEMGVHLQLSGDALRSLDARELDAQFLMRRLVGCKASFTRVDIALDIFDSAIDIAQLYSLFKARDYSGRAQGGSMITTTATGDTMYIGSWNSERFVRVYDKAAQMKSKQDWKRMELVLKDRYAKSFIATYQGEMTTEKLAGTMKGTVKAMADLNERTWKDILDGATDKVSLPKDIPNNTREWLLTSVPEAIVNYIIRTKDLGVLDDIQREIEYRYQKKTGAAVYDNET